MKLAIREFAAGSPTAAEIDALLAEHSFPHQDGTTTTFVYRGEADEVRLRHFIYGLPSSQPFQAIPGTDLWYLVFELPENSRIEYKLEIVSDGTTRWILDPLNPAIAHDPFGANSVCHGLGYERPPWTQPDPNARPGRLESLSIDSKVFGETRQVQVYLPERLRPVRNYPLVVAHDGPDFLRYTGLKTVLDNLIYRLEVPPLIVALTESPNRLVEYAGDPRHSRYIAEEVLPMLEVELPVDQNPASIGLLGASFGAVASLATAWRYPGTFGRLLLLSGSFAFTDIGENHNRGPAFDPVVRFMNAFRDAPGMPSERIFLGCGIYESLIYENRSLLPLLQGTGMKLRYVEARDGHNWENWRDRLREGLSWLFPGPLLMVYE